MKKITYRCNLCTEEKKKEDLKCLYWGHKNHEHKCTYYIVDDLDMSDKHICSDCISEINKIQD